MATSRVSLAFPLIVSGPRRLAVPAWRGLLLGMALLVLGFPAAADAVRRGRPTVFVPVSGAAGEGQDGGTDWAVADEVIVRFKPEAARRPAGLEREFGGRLRWLRKRPRQALAGPADGPVLEELAVIRLELGTDLGRAVEEIGRRPDVVYAEPNLRLRLTVQPGAGGDAGSSGSIPGPSVPPPNDFGFGRQWNLENTGQTAGKLGADIGALRAWAVTTGSTNVLVAIIDTGIDFFHPDLEPNIWTNPGELAGNGIDDDGNGYIDDVHGYDWVSDDSDPVDDNLHGTHVAGILGAVGNDETGVVGVAWSVRMMALKAFDETGAGSLDDTLVAVGYARRAGARIINASWGTTVRSRSLDEVSAEAVSAGVVFVGAAGNNGTDIRFFPAAVPEVIAVAATDAKDGSPTYSNYGSFVDLVAPGDGIYSTAPNANWTVLNGTSMAAPHVSGLAALLLSVQPAFTPDDVRAILQSTADEVTTDRFTGAGRISAARALKVTEPLPRGKLDVAPTWSGRVDVGGEVGGNRFAGYRLEIGAGSRPKVWEVLGAGGQPVAGGKLLAGLDTARFDDGEYTLRLVVTNAVGDQSTDRIPVVVGNVRLASPQNNDVIRGGESVEILGTVYGEGRTFELHWGLGQAPADWKALGVRLEADGQKPVVEGRLAVWDGSVLPAGGFVTLRLVARAGDRVVGESWARMVNLEPRLRPGWPRKFPFSDEVPVANWREFNLADLDGDGAQEVVLVDHGEPGGRPPRLMAFAGGAQVIWSRDLPAGAPEFDAPVIGDVDGDGRMEIFVDTGEGGQILAFNHRGEPLGGRWPVQPGGTHFGKILADVDADGRLDLVALSQPPADLVGTRQRDLVVLNAAGERLRHWTLNGCESATNRLEQLPAVIQLDDDPALEIVAVDGCQGISAFDLGKESGPVWTASTDANLFASPVTGDLDGDGEEEVVIGGVRRARDLPGGLYVFGSNGKLRGGWPVLVEESLPTPAALADLDGDGRLEIVVACWDSETIHAVQADGFELPGWPLPPQSQASTRSAPLVGDVDGDGHPDVVMASPGSWIPLVISGQTARAGGIRAWRADGTNIDFQPAGVPDGLAMEASSGPWYRFPPLAMGDLDGNGWLDVVAATIQDRRYSPDAPITSSKMRSTLYAWELPVRTAGLVPFSSYQGGPGRSGRYVRERPPNQPPRILAIPDQTTAPAGGFRPIPLNLYVQDPDHRADKLSWAVTVPEGSALGASVEAGNRAVIRPSDPLWTGRAPVRFQVRDPAGAEAVAVVFFEVRPGYVPPQAVTDALRLLEDESAGLNPLANDRSPSGRPLRIFGISRPGSGRTELLADGAVHYAPATNFFGLDRFEYTLVDDDGGTATGEVEVTVEGMPDAPEPQPDKLIIDEDTAGEFSTVENDTDPDQDAVEFVSIQPANEGTLEALGMGRHRYSPRPDFSGIELLTYLVRDPGGLVSTGEVSILVKPVNDLPVVHDQVVRVTRNRPIDVFYDAKDADGDRLTFQVVQGPTNGLVLAYPELANYEPRHGYSGHDQFTYTATDGRVTVGPATVFLEVQATNNPPEIQAESKVTAVDQSLTVGLRVRDLDGDTFTVRLEDGPDHGTARVQGTNVVYTPDPGFLGEDQFFVVARDAEGEGPRTSVTVRVTSENTEPIPEPEILEVPRNRPTPFVLRARDAENNPLRFEVVIPPAFGHLEGTPPDLVYTPRPNFRGLDRLQFTVGDGRLTSLLATEHFLVRDPNQIPVTTNQTVVVRKDGTGRIHLTATDADGHPLRAVILKGSRNGRVTGTGLEYRYVPKAGFEGVDSFTYKVWDGLAYSSDATVTVRVEPRTDPTVVVTSVRWLPEGLELELEARATRVLRLEASTNLIEWGLVGSWDSPAGPIRWVDVSAAGRTARFYRAVVEGFGEAP